jgi:hypothetical protein
MRTCPSLTSAPGSLLILTACNNSTPLPDAYAILIASGSEILRLVNRLLRER